MSMREGTPRPLAGVMILDLSMFVAGPFGTAVLADLGAEVIKVEPPGGDPIRHNRMGPQLGGVSAQYHTYNRGKRSLVLDLKAEAGRAVFADLTREADAIVDNFRPGVTTRLGIDHAAMAAINPTIVSVSLSAFGSTGPWTKRPGYDLIVQALSGGMSITGHRESGPAHIPYHLGDTAGGLYAAIAMLAAVLEARSTGRGRAYEVAMLDAQISLLGDEVTYHHTGEWAGEPHGAGHPALAPYAAYETADEPIVIAAVGIDKFWQNLLLALDLPALADDPRFADNAARCQNRDALDAVLRPALRARPSAHWLARFDEVDVPAAPVLGVGDAIASEQVVARGLIATVGAGGGAEAQVPVAPIRESGAGPFGPTGPAPGAGADSDAILRQTLRYSPAKINDLRTGGAFG